MMKLHEDHKKLIIVVFFGIISFSVIGMGSLIKQQRNTSNTEASSTNFDQYCQDGVYYVQKEGRRISCGRAPNCGGWSYDSTEQIEFRSKAECWVEDYFGGSRCNAYCAGNVPLCCYKLALTKNLEDCVWTERYYCHPSQCQGVGGGCGQNIQAWCINSDHCYNNVSDMPYLSLENRLSGQSQPQPTNTPQPQATATPQPQATSTVAPNQPTSTVPPNQPTSTLAPINSPIPTNQQPTSAANIKPSYNPQPTNPPLPTNTPYKFPTIEIKSPKELAREVINPESIQKLERGTEKVFDAPIDGLNTIKQADQKLEYTANAWIEKVRIFIENLIN